MDSDEDLISSVTTYKYLKNENNKISSVLTLDEFQNTVKELVYTFNERNEYKIIDYFDGSINKETLYSSSGDVISQREFNEKEKTENNFMAEDGSDILNTYTKEEIDKIIPKDEDTANKVSEIDEKEEGSIDDAEIIDVIYDSKDSTDDQNEISTYIGYNKPYKLSKEAKKYFTKIQWVKRNNKRSLSIYRHYNIYSYKYYDGRNKSWNAVSKLASKDSKWKNTASMKNQYLCHYDAAAWKTPWNIEPYKSNKGYYGFLWNLCN